MKGTGYLHPLHDDSFFAGDVREISWLRPSILQFRAFGPENGRRESRSVRRRRILFHVPSVVTAVDKDLAAACNDDARHFVAGRVNRRRIPRRPADPFIESRSARVRRGSRNGCTVSERTNTHHTWTSELRYAIVRWIIVKAGCRVPCPDKGRRGAETAGTVRATPRRSTIG